VAAAAAGEGSGAGYVRDMVTYTVMDDLSVAPMSTIGAVTALAALGVADISGLQAKTVEIGYKEVILLCILTTIGLRTWRLACVVCVPKFIHAFLIDQCQWAGFGVAQGVAQSKTVLTDVFLGAKGKGSGGARASDLGSRSPYRFRRNF
jgi:hypothetical protein